MLIKSLRKDGLMDDFNIEWLIERCKDQFDAEITTSAGTNLVNKGLIEQYIDEDGNFKFTLTELGRSIAKKLEKDGLLFTDFYSNGWTSDQGIASIFSSFPVFPYVAIINEIDKSRKLPCLNKSLKN